MTTLVLPHTIAEALLELTQLDVETGAVLLTHTVRTPGGNLRFLATNLVLVPDHAYERRDSHGLVVTSEGFVPPLRTAEESQATPFWVHTHPGNGSSPSPSKLDVKVDAQLAPLFRFRANTEFYGSLIVASKNSGLRFTGLVESEAGVVPLDRIWSVGPRLVLAHNADAQRPELSAVYDRNIRAFGGGVQQVLHDLTVAVVGCGGTGSAVAEQLVRLGVRRLVLIDPDTLSDSNLTRVYGSFEAAVGRPKVEVLAEHLGRIFSGLAITTLQSKITVEQTARGLLDADVVFGCTDDNAGRLVISRLATFLLVPVFDCGVILTSDDSNQLDGIYGRITILHPGAACLVCRGRIDLARAGAESLTPEEHGARVGEGYAPALPGVEPAVVAYTSQVGAHAVAELLERLTGYGPSPVPNEVILRIHEREISTNLSEPRNRHYCHPDSGKLGIGVTEPFLEQAWTA